MTDKGKKLKPVTDKNGVQTHRWVTDDDDRGAANADAVKRGLAPNVSMQNDPRTGNVPLFDEDELAETEEAQAQPQTPSGPPVFEPREGRAREPYRLNGDGPMVYEVDYGDAPGTDAQERVGKNGPPVFGPKKTEDSDSNPEPRRLNGNGPPVYRTAREREIDARLDEMNKNTNSNPEPRRLNGNGPPVYRTAREREIDARLDYGTPKTYRANVTTETGNPNAKRKAAERQERRSRWRDRIGALFGRRRR